MAEDAGNAFASHLKKDMIMQLDRVHDNLFELRRLYYDAACVKENATATVKDVQSRLKFLEEEINKLFG